MGTSAQRKALFAGRNYRYEPGAVRWLRVPDDYSVKKHPIDTGWKARLEELDYHPVTFNKLQVPQTWICETYTGEVTPRKRRS